MHYRARSYDPRTGRFNQKEPQMLLRVAKHYVFVENRPTSLTDPSGLQAGSWGVDWAKYKQKEFQELERKSEGFRVEARETIAKDFNKFGSYEFYKFMKLGILKGRMDIALTRIRGIYDFIPWNPFHSDSSGLFYPGTETMYLETSPARSSSLFHETAHAVQIYFGQGKYTWDLFNRKIERHAHFVSDSLFTLQLQQLREFEDYVRSKDFETAKKMWKIYLQGAHRLLYKDWGYGSPSNLDLGEVSTVFGIDTLSFSERVFIWMSYDKVGGDFKRVVNEAGFTDEHLRSIVTALD